MAESLVEYVGEILVVLEEFMFGLFQFMVGGRDVRPDRPDELFHRVEVHLGPQVLEDGHLHLGAVEGPVELLHDVHLHRPFGVLVVGVPADAHDHLVDGAAVDLGPPEVDARLHPVGEGVHDVLGEVRRRDPQVPRASAEPRHHRTTGEVGHHLSADK